MKKIYALLLAAVLPVGSLFSQVCYADWDYRMPITITNPNATALSAHEIRIDVNTSVLVSAGKMQAQGQDIRFYLGGCCDSLSYYIESGMNTSVTSIWVNVASVPANSTTTIYMLYGNPLAPAASSAPATFSFYEGFEGNTLQNFNIESCSGTGTPTVSGGTLSMSWSGSYILSSTTVLPQTAVYTGEAAVTAASGDWPGIYWLKDAIDNRGYATMQGGGQVRISKSGTSTGYCQGHNWASSLFPLSTSAGIWSSTWIATGNIIGEHPSSGPISTTDTQHARDTDMRLCIGGISSGSGSISMDWIRARKYAAVTPTFSNGSEESISGGSISVAIAADSAFVCSGDSVMVSALPNAGLSNYTWSNGNSGLNAYGSSTGFLSVAATNSLGCTSYDSLFIEVHPITPLNLGNDTTVCENSNIVLDAGSSYSTYLWSGGQNTSSITPASSGIYSVVVTDANGCVQSDQVQLSYFPSVTALFTSDASTQSLSVNFQNSSAGAATYTWDFGDGTQSAQQNPAHVYTAAGSYTVCLTATSSDQCSDQLCTQIEINNLSAQDFNTAGIRMYPNPSSGVLNLVVPASFGVQEISLTDASGRKVLSRNGAAEGIVTLQTENLRSGMYIVHILSDQGHFSSVLIRK